MYSLKRSLQKNLLLAVTLLMFGLLFASYTGVQKIMVGFLESRLAHDADSLVSGLQLDSRNQWQLSSARTSTIYDRVRSGHYYIVNTGSQQFRSRSLFDTQVDLNTLESLGDTCFTLEQQIHSGERWHLCLRSFVKAGSTISIWVAEDILPLERQLHDYLALASLIIIIAISMLLVVQHLFLKNGFSQLEEARSALNHIQKSGGLIEHSQFPSEISPLMEEINRLLSQLDQRITRSRNALANVAHELKRPLQRFQLLNEMHQSNGEYSVVHQDIQAIIDRELKRARIAGVVTAGRHFALPGDLVTLREAFAKMYPHIEITMHWPDKTSIVFDRDDMMELLGNLADNACKFARSRAQIQLSAHPSYLSITVEDDGRGVETEQLHMICERGVRLDESVSGNGIGLSICQDIVASYQGTIRFEHSSLGGLKVYIQLPTGSAE